MSGTICLYTEFFTRLVCIFLAPHFHTVIILPIIISKYLVRSIAAKIVSSTLSGQYTVYWGLEGWMLATLTAGMGPVTSMVDALCQIFLMGLLRFISLFYLMDFRRTIAKCKNERVQEKTE